MKTAEQQLQRMEALVRKMANSRVGLDMMQNIEDYLTAQSIVAELPDPASPDVLIARGLAAGVIRHQVGDEGIALDYENGEWDNDEEVVAIVQALRSAREEGVK